MTEKRDLGAIYTEEWFRKDFAELWPEFQLVARGIDRWFLDWHPEAYERRVALDVGCGPGLLVDGLYELGWTSSGFDGSPHALSIAAEMRRARDGNIPWPELRVADIMEEEWHAAPSIVICTEVAEHLPAVQAPGLVHYLTSLRPRAILFTAAPPGQGGHDHVNEQPRGYWVSRFECHGWKLDEHRTKSLVERWEYLKRLRHMKRNLMVFT